MIGRSGNKLAVVGGVILLYLLAAWFGQKGIASVSANAPFDSGIGSVLYLPILQKAETPNIARIVVTERGYSLGYPGYVWVYGYVENLSPTENYSITVGIDVKTYPYCDPIDPVPDCDPYTVVEAVATAFDVTLPGQINPFKHSKMTAKTDYSLGSMHLLSVLPASQNIHPVRIVNWSRNDGVVSGVAGNDTMYTLSGVQVVVGTNGCSWRDTSLDSTVLLPGQETFFSREFLFCEDEELYVVGQGKSKQRIAP